MGTMEKPHRGAIKNWRRKYFGSGYVIIGEFVDNAGKRKSTSYVLRHDEVTGEIETLNNRYTLLGQEKDQIRWQKYQIRWRVD
jgi:hypothetical protein